MNQSKTPFYDQIQLLIGEMDIILANLQSESVRNNPNLRDQSMIRIKEIQKKIHDLKIKRIASDLTLPSIWSDELSKKCIHHFDDNQDDDNPLQPTTFSVIIVGDIYIKVISYNFKSVFQGSVSLSQLKVVNQLLMKLIQKFIFPGNVRAIKNVEVFSNCILGSKRCADESKGFPLA